MILVSCKSNTASENLSPENINTQILGYWLTDSVNANGLKAIIFFDGTIVRGYIQSASSSQEYTYVGSYAYHLLGYTGSSGNWALYSLTEGRTPNDIAFTSSVSSGFSVSNEVGGLAGLDGHVISLSTVNPSFSKVGDATALFNQGITLLP